MSLVRHAKSPFWYMSFMVKGKTIFRSTKTNNKALAQKIENETRRQMVEDIHFEKKGGITLKEIIDEHLATKEGSKGFSQYGVNARKLLGSKVCWKTKKPMRIFGFDGSMMFHDLKEKDLFRLMMARKKEGVTTGTFLHELLFISGMLSVAKQLGYQLPDINIKDFKKEHKLKQERKPIRYLSADEEQRLLAELDPMNYFKGVAKPEDQKGDMKRIRQDNYDFVVMLLDTGARHEEIAVIEWTSINLEERTIRLYRGKVNNESTLTMTNRLFEILNHRSQNKDSKQYVFTNKSGGPRNYSINGLANAVRRAGIKDCAFHTMRKTLASKLVRGGLAINDVSAVLGHASVSTTQTYYASLSPAASSQRATAMLDKLNG